jgi:hypothetical protein
MQYKGYDQMIKNEYPNAEDYKKITVNDEKSGQGYN